MILFNVSPSSISGIKTILSIVTTKEKSKKQLNSTVAVPLFGLPFLTKSKSNNGSRGSITISPYPMPIDGIEYVLANTEKTSMYIYAFFILFMVEGKNNYTFANYRYNFKINVLKNE